MKKLLPIIAALLMMAGTTAAQSTVSDTKYDWSGLATQVVGGTTDKYEQAYKIFSWLCDNIAYDTSYSIHTADSCYEQRKGVCQAYSELFYRMGEAVGLKVDIVNGESKNIHGEVSPEGHAWVFAYTADNQGILIDPTWGAGSVVNGQFEREKNDSWFHVDPYWMIFSHFPDNEVYQLMEQKIDYPTFCSLPSYRPYYQEFGQDAHRLFLQCLGGEEPHLPAYYPQDLSFIEVNNLPTEGVLRVGKHYPFVLKLKREAELMIHNGKDYHKEWTSVEGYEACNYMPAEEGILSLNVKHPDGLWYVLAEYKVATPTAEEVARLEAAYPHRSPILPTLKNYQESAWREHLPDFAGFLTSVKEQGATSLPIIYDVPGYTIHRIPLTEELRTGESYTFAIAPQTGLAWAVINEKEWYRDWTKDAETGIQTITVTPQKAGKLRISVQQKADGGYMGCIEYKVR